LKQKALKPPRPPKLKTLQRPLPLLKPKLMPPPLKLTVDPVALLLEDRQGEE